jgi:UDP-N-acetylglucosamine transferase subunit ALG13
VIFVTLGTHHQPFPRLIEALSGLPREELVVQHGHSPAPDAHEAVDFLDFGSMLERVREASVVVTHAGVGSILLARREGHVPVVVPRLHRLGEHVDDHQVELTEALVAEDKVIAVWNGTDLSAAVEAAPPRGEPRPPKPCPLHDAVRAALLDP